MSRRPSRAVATLAVGFLLLDALLLIWFGVELDRSRLVWGGIVCGLGAGAVVVLWRRYRRLLADVDAGKREMKQAAESIRQLLKEKHLHN